MRGFDRDLIRGGHYGQRSCEPHSKAEHMAAPTNAANVKKALANPEPSTHGPKATKPGPDLKYENGVPNVVNRGAPLPNLLRLSPTLRRLRHFRARRA